ASTSAVVYQIWYTAPDVRYWNGSGDCPASDAMPTVSLSASFDWSTAPAALLLAPALVEAPVVPAAVVAGVEFELLSPPHAASAAAARAPPVSARNVRRE